MSETRRGREKGRELGLRREGVGGENDRERERKREDGELQILKENSVSLTHLEVLIRRINYSRRTLRPSRLGLRTAGHTNTVRDGTN